MSALEAQDDARPLDVVPDGRDEVRHLVEALHTPDAADELDLDELAAIAMLSKFHFLRSFAKVYGLTPLAYLGERRVERAQDLLRATNLTVTEVCHAVGYSSLGSFSSRFTEIVGETPSAYRSRSHDELRGIPSCIVKQVTRPTRK